MKEITSTQNNLVKQILQLKEKSKERRKSGLFVIEGQRELKLALKGNYNIQTLLFFADIFSEENLDALIKKLPSVEFIKISKEVYQKLAYRQTTEGVLAIAQSKPHSLNSLDLKNANPLILVAEAPEKPGNIGALLRTADAANLDAVIIANPKSDLYNPNIIRSSVGCVFTNKIATGTTMEIIEYLQLKKIAINCAALTAPVNYSTLDYTVPTAIVVGTEATGLSGEWLDASDQNILIPMQGEIDSMNVSVAAAIVIFEAKRQRGFL
ncbi:TrmH family RNA methyltransferase [Galbibacter pacificus]|uniref:RNA methyltransferase n=1 Tax=Galbibacter pacificus TaxID=2996052 RepID=A0ABT6FNL1_9FLAO|nr:RNA methyltransferase [Galbibacter pacificus]MDG3581322.1 RNA methyltransferase [Galbibacter pacificus]MDG3584800.1 RNA methyltransferase [Galbibacter pacificus]